MKKRIFYVVSSVECDYLKVRIREGSIAGLSHIRKACAPRLTHDSFISKVWKNGKIHIIVEIWGHMLFWYGRGQQSTPPESRKIRTFRKKPLKNSTCFSSVVFYIFPLRTHLETWVEPLEAVWRNFWVLFSVPNAARSVVCCGSAFVSKGGGDKTACASDEWWVIFS